MKVGRIYFAMVDSSDVFDPDVHNVEDLQVFDLKISQSEGEFARAQLEIPNPGMGLLSPTRKQYIFISCDFDGDVVPIFAGRVIGFPTDFGTETVTVEYIAQSATWATDQTTFLNTLKVAPYYNVLFTELDERDDPVEILATRSALLYWSRFPGGGISLSDIVQGTATVDLGDDILFDSLSTNIGDPPLKRIDGTIEVQWSQTGLGEVDVGTKIRDEFVNTGGAPTPEINSLTPLAFEAGWKGVDVPTGYSIKQSILTSTISSFGLTAPYLKSDTTVVSSEFFPKENGGPFVPRTTHVPRVWYNGILKLNAMYEQKRKEILSFSLVSETQEFSLSSESFETMSFKLQDPTEAAQTSILNPNNPTFFYAPITHILTSYGEDVIENALLRARARLIKSARAVETNFETAVSSLDILQLTCDHSVRIVDDRVPGGALRGKVLGYNFHFSATDQLVEISAGSIIGTGIDTVGAGTELATVVYDNEDTVDIDPTMTSKLIYDLGTVPAPSVPIDVPTLQSDPFYVIDSVAVDDDGDTQNIDFPSQARPDIYYQTNSTKVTVDLKSMNPQNELLLEFDLDTFPLTLPQHINLEAT